jgi:hypothetical protein
MMMANIAIDSGNHFHMGWVTCLLGLPKSRPGSSSLRANDVAAFEDGWEMCDETGRKSAFEALDKMVAQKHLTVFWAEDSKEI